MGGDNSISIVVPVYNAAAWLPELWARLEAATGEVREWIFVNDGSDDDTGEILRILQSNDPRVRVVAWPRPLGLSVALREGVGHARGDFVVTLDDDLEHPPEEIPRLVERLRLGADLVYGSPRRHPRAWWRNAARRVTQSLMFLLSGHPLPRPFRAFRRELLREPAPYGAILDFLLLSRAKHCLHIDVEYHPSRRPRSSHTVLSLVSLFLSGLRQINMVRTRV